MDRQTKTVFTFLEEFKTLKPGFLLLGAAAEQLSRFGEIPHKQTNAQMDRQTDKQTNENFINFLRKFQNPKTGFPITRSSSSAALTFW